MLLLGTLLLTTMIIVLVDKNQNINTTNNPVTTPIDTITTTCCPVDGTYVDTVTQLPK